MVPRTGQSPAWPRYLAKVMLSRTQPFIDELERALPSRPFAVELWDGTAWRPRTAAGLRSRCARRRRSATSCARPGSSASAGPTCPARSTSTTSREALALLDSWSRRRSTPARARLAAAVRAAGLSPARRPEAELRPRGRRHSVERDGRSVRHHYDVSNDFFELFLGESMTYCCAMFSRGATTLEEAQEAKLELVCTKLGLEPGSACSTWAAAGAASPSTPPRATACSGRHHALGAAGRGARERAAEAGVADRVEIRVQDYRELGGERFDRVAWIGMVEHVGAATDRRVRASRWPARWSPAGCCSTTASRGCARATPRRARSPSASCSRTRRRCTSRASVGARDDGHDDRPRRGLRADYAETLRHWARRLDDRIDEATRLAGPERVRVWRLYLRAARRGFESGFTSVYQVRGSRPQPG